MSETGRPLGSERLHLISEANEFDVSERPDENLGVFVSGERQVEALPTKFINDEITVGADTVTWTLELPEKPSYSGLVLFSPGFTGIKPSSAPLSSAIARQGIACLTYSPARKDGLPWWVTAKDPQQLHVDTLNKVSQTLRSRLDVRREVDPTTQTLVAHSMGGLSITRYALETDTNVERIVGLATVGFGHPSLSELVYDLAKGGVGSIRHEILPSISGGEFELSLGNILEFARYNRNLVRIIAEGISCLRDDVENEVARVARLHELGIHYYYVAYQHDTLVRADPRIRRFVHHHEIIPGAGHLQPLKRPERTAAIIKKFMGLDAA